MCRLVVGHAGADGRGGEATTADCLTTTVTTTAQVNTIPATQKTIEDDDVEITNFEEAAWVATRGQKKSLQRDKISTSRACKMTKKELLSHFGDCI